MDESSTKAVQGHGSTGAGQYSSHDSCSWPCLLNVAVFVMTHCGKHGKPSMLQHDSPLLPTSVLAIARQGG
jgi:hypothetical protein